MLDPDKGGLGAVSHQQTLQYQTPGTGHAGVRPSTRPAPAVGTGRARQSAARSQGGGSCAGGPLPWEFLHRCCILLQVLHFSCTVIKSVAASQIGIHFALEEVSLLDVMYGT